MVRVYKRKPEAKKYKDYDPKTINKAFAEDGWSQQRTSGEFKIPCWILIDKYHERHIRKDHAQTIFSRNEEKVFLSDASTCGEWKFPSEIVD